MDLNSELKLNSAKIYLDWYWSFLNTEKIGNFLDQENVGKKTLNIIFVSQFFTRGWKFEFYGAVKFGTFSNLREFTV